MIIRFKEDCGFWVESYDKETEITEGRDETFKASEEVVGKIVIDHGDYVSFQFSNGSMIYGLKRELFEVVKE